MAGASFPNLLAAALERAFPLKEVHNIVAIAQYLNFDVSRALNHFLDVEPTIPECRLRFGARQRCLLLEFIHRLDDADSAASTTGSSFDHHPEIRSPRPVSSLGRNRRSGRHCRAL